MPTGVGRPSAASTSNTRRPPAVRTDGRSGSTAARSRRPALGEVAGDATAGIGEREQDVAPTPSGSALTRPLSCSLSIRRLTLLHSECKVPPSAAIVDTGGTHD